MKDNREREKDWIVVQSGLRRTLPTRREDAEKAYSVTVGRRRGEQAKMPQTEEQGGASLRMRCAALLGVIGLLLCGTYLCLILTGRPGRSGGFPEAGAALRESILEEEALAVFLGLEGKSSEEEDAFSEEAVLVMSGTTDDSFLPEKPNVGGDGWNFWDYIAGLLAKLVEMP